MTRSGSSDSFIRGERGAEAPLYPYSSEYTILKPFYLSGFSLFPSRRVSALALHFRSFPAA
jgi:hypothetical protein